jgi:hypothetical protein
MKGYLQRLINSNSPNEQRVFPLAASVYAAPSADQEPDAVPTQIQSREPQDFIEGIERYPDHRSPGAREQNEPAIPRLSGLLIPKQAHDPFSSVSADQQQRADQVTSFRTASSPDRINDFSLRTEVPHESSPQERLDEARPTVTTLMPPISPNDDVRLGADPERVKDNSVNNTGPLLSSQSAFSFVDRRKDETHGREEVQIHIGRIEVIATPPPAARTNPAASNRFTSLADYLNERNGRSR